MPIPIPMPPSSCLLIFLISVSLTARICMTASTSSARAIPAVFQANFFPLQIKNALSTVSSKRPARPPADVQPIQKLPPLNEKKEGEMITTIRTAAAADNEPKAGKGKRVRTAAGRSSLAWRRGGGCQQLVRGPILCWLCTLLSGPPSSVCLRSNRSPGILDGSMRNVSAMRGDTVEFRCRLENAGKHTVAFFRDGIPPRLIAYDQSVFRRSDKYELLARPGGSDQWLLRIRDVQEDDGGGYICQLNSSPVLAMVGHLELKIPPSISRSSTPAAVEVREGHNVTLQCHARGNPPPTIVWRRADRQVIRYNGADGYGDSVHKGANLPLVRVSRQHMSEYVCVASNGIAPDESWSIKLHVLFEPVVVPQSLVVEVPLNALVARIACTVEAWPRPNMVWLFEGQPLRDSSKFATEQSVSERYKSVHVLEIRQVQRAEFGVYRCVASNDYGSHFGEIRLLEAPPLDGDLLLSSLNEGSGSANPDDEDSGGWQWKSGGDPYSRASTSPSLWIRQQLSPDKELRRSVSRSGGSSSNGGHRPMQLGASAAFGPLRWHCDGLFQLMVPLFLLQFFLCCPLLFVPFL